jgi:DNA-directed RNA polymerase subunit N (RpoN/RPB10)
MPVQIAVQGTLFHPSEWVNIKGRVVDGKGAGIADVVLHYGDRIVQTDSKGIFEFTGVTRNCSLEIEAASMPFAHFPIEGYTQQFALKSKHNQVEIRCFSSGGVRGDVLTKFSNAIGLRSPIHYDDLVIVLQNEGQNYTCEIDATGAFRISGIPPGEYLLYIQGLSNDYRFSPASVSVEEGSITSLPLTIWEVEQTIPMQQL